MNMIMNPPLKIITYRKEPGRFGPVHTPRMWTEEFPQRDFTNSYGRGYGVSVRLTDVLCQREQ